MITAAFSALLDAGVSAEEIGLIRHALEHRAKYGFRSLCKDADEFIALYRKLGGENDIEPPEPHQ